MARKAIPTSHSFDPPAEAAWHRMIAEAAYYRAQRPEFAGESALEHWLAAEAEVRILLSGGPNEVQQQARAAQAQHRTRGTIPSVKNSKRRK